VRGLLQQVGSCPCKSPLVSAGFFFDRTLFAGD
jgi:hypothetical protein